MVLFLHPKKVCVAGGFFALKAEPAFGRALKIGLKNI
jgi:hypothetical protein